MFIPYTVTLLLEVLHHPIRGVVKKHNFLQVEKEEISPLPRESPTTALGTVHVAFTGMNRQRKSCNFFELISDNSQNLAGDSKCRRQSSFLQSLACFCLVTADALKSEASPVKGLKFYLFVL